MSEPPLSPEPRIAVTGATGHLGGAVARELHDLGANLRLVVRDPERAPDLPGADLAVAGYGDTEAMQRALSGAETLYLVSGAESVDRLEQHRSAVRAAAAAGIQRVVYTSFIGAAPEATFTLARDHFHTEQALAQAGLPYVALRNNLYADLVPFFATDGAIRGPAGDGRLAPVARRDIVAVSLVALQDPTLTGPLDVTGPELHTLAEVAALIGEVTGRPTGYIDETVEEARTSRASYDAPDWQVEAWISTYTAIARGEMAVVSDTIQRLTGRPATPLRDVVAEVSPG